MQITKSTEQKVEKSIVPFKEHVKEFPKAVGKFFTERKKKTLIITASVLVIAAATRLPTMSPPLPRTKEQMFPMMRNREKVSLRWQSQIGKEQGTKRLKYCKPW